MKIAWIKSKLVALANDLDRDFNALALEFAIERLVVRLQENQDLTKHLIFKGGQIGRNMVFGLRKRRPFLMIPMADTSWIMIILTMKTDLWE